jgi:hypothetical protein
MVLLVKGRKFEKKTGYMKVTKQIMTLIVANGDIMLFVNLFGISITHCTHLMSDMHL